MYYDAWMKDWKLDNRVIHKNTVAAAKTSEIYHNEQQSKSLRQWRYRPPKSIGNEMLFLFFNI